MSKVFKIMSIPALIVLLALGMTSCMEEKVIEIVLGHETSVDFSQNSASEIFTDTEEIELGTEIDDALADAGFTKEDIVDAFTVSVGYGVTMYEGATDWIISGEVTVERTDILGPRDPVVLINYASQSVPDALGKRISAELTTEGVAVMDAALDDYLGGLYPTLEFVVNNGSVSPAPSEGNRIIFDWRAWLTMQIIFTQTYDIPDPF